MRPTLVGPGWHELFQPGTPLAPPCLARVLVVSDIVGALTHIHDNPGAPASHRRHGRVTPRHILIGLDGSASLAHVRFPFSRPLPVQPDLGFLAPEVLDESGPATARSDVFSAGVLLWEALDNGRLFPHRQASAISRLIARQSLPHPRIEDEWAHPLRAIALQALSVDPGKRQRDATELWSQLRDCLPAVDDARTLLASQVQGLLQLSVTDQIRNKPPYWVPERPSAAPSGGSERPPTAAGNQARYSMAPPNSEICIRRAVSAQSDSSSRTRQNSTEHRAGAPQSGVVRTARSHKARRSSQAPKLIHEDKASVESIAVNLPRDLINASLPYLLTSSAPPTTSTPWGLVALAGMAFFAVGAAVALGAVNALRPPAPVTLPAISVTVPNQITPTPALASTPLSTAARTPARSPEAAVSTPINEPPPAAAKSTTTASTIKNRRKSRSSAKRRRKPVSKRPRPSRPPADNLPFAETPF